MLRNQFDKNYNYDKYLFISDYIYQNYDKFITNDSIKTYIVNSTRLINKYRNIWINIHDDKRIISNIIALNLYLLNL